MFFVLRYCLSLSLSCVLITNLWLLEIVPLCVFIELIPYLEDIARKIQKKLPSKRIYILQGGKIILPIYDREYKNADIVIIGQPGDRAMVLPDIYNMIWNVPSLLDSCIQQQRQNNYFEDDRPSAYWVTPEGNGGPKYGNM